MWFDSFLEGYHGRRAVVRKVTRWSGRRLAGAIAATLAWLGAVAIVAWLVLR